MVHDLLFLEQGADALHDGAWFPRRGNSMRLRMNLVLWLTNALQLALTWASSVPF